MSGATSSKVGGRTYDTSLSDAYAKGGASASQVQAIRNREIAHQDSVRSGGTGYYSTSNGGSSVSTSASPQSLRDYVNSIGQTLNYNNGTTLMNGNAYKTGSIPGTVYDPKTQQHYVTNQDAVRSIYGLGGTPTLTTTTPTPDLVPEDTIKQPEEIYELPEPVDNSAYIQQLAQAQRQSRISALDKARTTALSSLDNQRAGIAPTYYDKKNQAAAQSDVGAMNFANYMAARGIRGAAGAMPEIYRQAGLQGQLGAYDRQEAAELGAIERQRANIEAGYASDVAAAEADTEAQTMQGLINQWNTDRTYAMQKAAQDYDIQQGNTERARSAEDTKKQEWISNIGQYANDYAAQINAVQGDGDPSNDWQIAYLQTARNKKLAELQEAAVKAAQQDIENQQKWAQINKTGSKGGGGSKPSTSINQQYTQQVIAQLLKHNDTGRANLFNQYASYWAENGVDVAKVQSAVGLLDD